MSKLALEELEKTFTQLQAFAEREGFKFLAYKVTVLQHHIEALEEEVADLEGDKHRIEWELDARTSGLRQQRDDLAHYLDDGPCLCHKFESPMKCVRCIACSYLIQKEEEK